MFEAYAVAVRVSLINGVAGGLMAMSRQFQRVHGDAASLQGQIDKISRTMLVGGALTATGVGLFGLIGKTLPAAKEYQHQLAQMNVAGMRHLEITKATAAAWEATRTIPTSKVAENLAAIRELRSVFGTTQEAINALPSMLKLQAVLSNVKGVADAKGTAYDVAKLLDIRGASMDPARFQAESNAMLKAIVASGGTLGAKDFFGTGKYGRLATQGWSSEFLYQVLPTLMQEMKSGSGAGGAGGPGNAMMSAYSAVVGGTISQKSLAIWNQLGLLDPTKVVWTKAGSAKGVLPGGIKGTELFQANPLQWSQQVLMPALVSAGITDPKKQQQYLQMLFSNRTAGFAMSQLALQPEKFRRDQRLIQGAMGMEAYETLLKTDPIMAQQALAAQWNSILTALGTEILPDVINAMHALMPMLRDFSKWLRSNPEGVRALMRTAATVGGILVTLGGINLAAGTIRSFALLFGVLKVAVGLGTKLPLLATGITSVTGALAGMSAVGLISLGAGLLAVVAGLSALALWVRYHKEVGAEMNRSGKVTPGGLAMSGRLGPMQSTVVPGHKPRELFRTPSWLNSTEPSPFVPKAGNIQKQSFTGDVHMDGQKVGKVVWRHETKAADRAARASGSRVDPGRSLAPAGLGYA